MRTLEELRGSLASLRRASKRSSAGTFKSSALSLRAARRAAYWATSFSRFLLRLIWDVFAIVSASIRRKGELEAFEKRAGFLVGLRRSVEHDIHAPHRFGLVVIDFQEHDVLLHAHGIVASAVEGLGIDAAEVAHARQRHGDQPIDEFVHLVAAQGDLGADRQVLADLEGRDRLLGAGLYRLLAGNRRQVVYRLRDL